MPDRFFSLLLQLGLPLLVVLFVSFVAVGWLRRRQNERTFVQTLLRSLLWSFCWSLFVAVLGAAFIT